MEKAIVLLASSLFLALFIERLIEMLKALYDVVETKRGRHARWNDLAQKVANQLYSRMTENKGDNKFEDFHLKLVSQYLFSNHPHYQGSLVVSSDRIRTIFMKYLAKVVGVVLGVIFACVTDINVFVLVEQSTPRTEELPQILSTSWLTGGFGVFFFFFFMGLGSGPMHKFIVALERARRKRKNTGLV